MSYYGQNILERDRECDELRRQVRAYRRWLQAEARRHMDAVIDDPSNIRAGGAHAAINAAINRLDEWAP